MKKCGNQTCTNTCKRVYCSRRCQNTTRNVGHKGQLPDIWVGMDTERALQIRAHILGLTVRDLIVNLLEAEASQVIGWNRLDFGPPELAHEPV